MFKSGVFADLSFHNDDDYDKIRGFPKVKAAEQSAERKRKRDQSLLIYFNHKRSVCFNPVQSGLYILCFNVFC